MSEYAGVQSPNQGRRPKGSIGGLARWRSRATRFLPQSRVLRLLMLIAPALVVGGGITFALQRYFTAHVGRLGPERSLVFRLDAPYGSVNVLAGGNDKDVATIETLSEDVAARNCQWSYGIQNGTVGVLRIGVGTDGEGMITSPPIALSYANSGYSLAASQEPQSDQGYRRHIVPFASPLSPLFGTFNYYYGFHYRMRPRSVSTDEGTRVLPLAVAETNIYLTRNLPLDFSANLGFGVSQINLSGLPLMSATIQTGASQAYISCNSENPEPLRNFVLSAGMGSCTFTGISNLNAYRLAFHGAVGSYHLGFDGKLIHNLDAIIDIGLGLCTIVIPPTAGRVQIFYQEGLGSSFSFSGLAVQRDGYATSPGFNLSRAPILTLHLSSAVGRIAVSYH